jgi:hypothetical protein
MSILIFNQLVDVKLPYRFEGKRDFLESLSNNFFIEQDEFEF